MTTPHPQRVTIAARATSFTAVCEICHAPDASAAWSSSTFGGRLDLDVDQATFLCRRGHPIRVERLGQPAADGATAAA